jgi:hypothetical protein
MGLAEPHLGSLAMVAPLLEEPYTMVVEASPCLHTHTHTDTHTTVRAMQSPIEGIEPL